jgi:aspartate oxidase
MIVGMVRNQSTIADLQEKLETLKSQNKTQAIALEELQYNMYRQCEIEKTLMRKEITADACHKTIDLVCYDNAKEPQKCLEKLYYVCRILGE